MARLAAVLGLTGTCLLLACTSEPLASEFGTPTPGPASTRPDGQAIATPTETPPATVAPTAALGEGAPTASATQDGIRVELWLDHQAVQLHDQVRALARVSNVGNENPTWETNTCSFGPAEVTATDDTPLGPGRTWDGLAAKFKALALAEAGVEASGQANLGSFIEEAVAGKDTVPCAETSNREPFVPGQVVEATTVWTAAGRPGLPALSGSLTIAATFSSSLGDVSAETHLPFSGVAGNADLTLVDYVDLALSQKAFRAWLGAHPRSSWINTGIGFWPNGRSEYPPSKAYQRAGPEGAVDVELYAREGGGKVASGSVILDAATGDFLGKRLE